MATPPSFPTLAGQGWSVHKTPKFGTVVAPHVSGRKVRAALYVNPIWMFELVFNGLDGTATGQYGALGASSLQSLMGFFLQCQGQYATFLFTDPSDDAVANQTMGIGNGTKTTFALTRLLGAFAEPVGWVTAITAVYLNGVQQTTGWILTTPNSLIFTSPPGNNVTIAASFTFAFLCRFDSDEVDFEQFMSNLWKVDSLKFRSVRPS